MKTTSQDIVANIEIVHCFVWRRKSGPWRRPEPGACKVWLACERAFDTLPLGTRTGTGRYAPFVCPPSIVDMLLCGIVSATESHVLCCSCPCLWPGLGPCRLFSMRHCMGGGLLCCGQKKNTRHLQEFGHSATTPTRVKLEQSFLGMFPDNIAERSRAHKAITLHLHLLGLKQLWTNSHWSTLF